MRPSAWNAPEGTTVSSAILFHCATVFPGGSAAAASRVVPPDAATASATAAIAATRRTFVLLRFMHLHLLWWRPLDGKRPDPSRSHSSSFPLCARDGSR